MRSTEAPFSFAFQPIVNIEAGEVVAYEALIRGPAGEPASHVLDRCVGPERLHLDHIARLRAIRLAASLQLKCSLSLNFSPEVLDHTPNSIHTMVTIAREVGLLPEQLILEVTEGAVINDPARFAERINVYRSDGLRLAIDDFGAGYAGLNLLADFQPDIVKIDLGLVRDIDSRGPRQAIVRAVLQACADLGLDVIAEGVESPAELNWFSQRGVSLFQGFLLGRPAFEQLIPPKMPARSRPPAPTSKGPA